ncbi:PEP-CTERM motif protein [Opitutaceae bacterium TAV5]|nr:PEP-CTERM motif protein [Opitutaceae bacterium TAV5]
MISLKRHTRTVLGPLAALAVLASSPLASAGVTLVEELFGYADGNLAGGNGGTGFTTAWSGGASIDGTGLWTVNDGVATITGTRDTTASRAFDSLSDTFYFSFDVSVAAFTSAAGSFNDQLVFQTWNGSSWSDVFSVGIAYGTGGATGRYRVNGGDFNAGGFDVSGGVNTITGKFTFGGDGSATLTLWLNADDENAPPLTTRTLTASVDNIGRLFLRRQDGNRNGAGTVTAFDNLRIGTDWESATTSQVIPEPGTWAVLAGLLAAGVAIAARIRHRL